MPRTFVRSYVRKGGQGPTESLTGKFFNNVISQGIAINAAWDGIKFPLLLSIRALRGSLGMSSESSETEPADLWDRHRLPLPRAGWAQPVGAVRQMAW